MRPGEFFGNPKKITVPSGTAVTAVAIPEMRQHEHADCHFVFVTRGLYQTSAVGSAGIIGEGQAVLHFPGTCHVDKLIGEGSFSALSFSTELLSSASKPTNLAQKNNWFLVNDASTGTASAS
ncbi:MAG: hypothetical protein KBA31_17505 [Alphaproteobacteria bacterium]|nr:hypothetical protein [Alphaproteobacteria bacterium]